MWSSNVQVVQGALGGFQPLSKLPALAGSTLLHLANGRPKKPGYGRLTNHWLETNQREEEYQMKRVRFK
jgi:hypothetical protein